MLHMVVSPISIIYKFSDYHPPPEPITTSESGPEPPSEDRPGTYNPESSGSAAKVSEDFEDSWTGELPSPNAEASLWMYDLKTTIVKPVLQFENSNSVNRSGRGEKKSRRAAPERCGQQKSWQRHGSSLGE